MTKYQQMLKLWGNNRREQSTMLPDHLPEKLLQSMSEFARKIEISMIRGNFEQARMLVRQAEDTFNECQDEVKAKLDDHISALDLDVRTCNYLESVNVFTVYDLMTTPQSVILNIPGVSDRTWEMLEDRFTRHGLVHGGSSDRIAVLEKTGFRQ